MEELDGSGNIVADHEYGPTGYLGNNDRGPFNTFTTDPTGNGIQSYSIAAGFSPVAYPMGAYGTLGGTNVPSLYYKLQNDYYYGWNGYTGLIGMGARNYDAQTGRFLTRDPMGYGGGMNLYAFAGGDPINYSDPLGLYPGDMNTSLPGSTNPQTFVEEEEGTDPEHAALEREEHPQPAYTYGSGGGGSGGGGTGASAQLRIDLDEGEDGATTVCNTGGGRQLSAYQLLRIKQGIEAEEVWRNSFPGTIFRPKSGGNANGPDAIYLDGVYPGFNVGELKPTTMRAEGIAQLNGRAAQGYYGRGALFLWHMEASQYKFLGPVYKVDLGPDPQLSLLFGDPE